MNFHKSGIFIINNYMNWFLIGIIIFVIVYLFLNWFAKTSTKKIAQFLKRLAIVISILLAAILAIGGKYIEKIEGCFSNVMGLSLPWLRENLYR